MWAGEVGLCSLQDCEHGGCSTEMKQSVAFHGDMLVWRVRRRRKARSPSYPRQNRSAAPNALNPRIHRIRPFTPRWCCSHLHRGAAEDAAGSTRSTGASRGRRDHFRRGRTANPAAARRGRTGGGQGCAARDLRGDRVGATAERAGPTHSKVRFSWILLDRCPHNERELCTLHGALFALGSGLSAADIARMVNGVARRYDQRIGTFAIKRCPSGNAHGSGSYWSWPRSRR